MTTAGASFAERRESEIASIVPLVPAWRVDRTFDYRVPADLSVDLGTVVEIPFGHRRVRGIVVGLERRDEGRGGRDLEPIRRLVLPAPVCPPPLDSVLAWIADRYVAPRGRVFARVVPPRVRVRPDPPLPLQGGPSPCRVSSYVGGSDLIRAIEERRPRFWSLRTLPTEDKGELVAELVAAAGRAGAGALVAVPEVRFGSKVLDALERHWPDVVRVDSSVGDAERSRSWMRLAAGHGLGAGGRATVLAPVPQLGLIVVDDEHDISYKEERSPRYDARRVALERARRQRAACVLISATPSLDLVRPGDEAWGFAYPRREASRAARPVVELVEKPRDRAISHPLHERIRDALRAGERVALVVPARGYARAVWCSDCRRSVRCPVCEAGVFFDRSPRRIRCPRCGHTAVPPDVCPHCGSADLRYLGAGSERLGEQIAASFPRASVVRVDPDALPADGDRIRDADIYVATWIGTKETIRPEVQLVGVLDADALIRRPDFRAAEHAFQALAAMAAWAGPASRRGHLLIQTSDPAHHCVQAVTRADYEYFRQRELSLRRELSYPPFAELMKVTADGGDAHEAITRVAGVCRTAGGRVLGPIVRRRSTPRGVVTSHEMLVKCARVEAVSAELRDILASDPLDARLRVDVDPR